MAERETGVISPHLSPAKAHLKTAGRASISWVRVPLSARRDLIPTRLTRGSYRRSLGGIQNGIVLSSGLEPTDNPRRCEALLDLC